MSKTKRKPVCQRVQAPMDTSARADGMRAFAIGLPRGSCPHRYSPGAMNAWLGGYDLAASGAVIAPKVH